MKATGAEITRFFESSWPDGWFIDDAELEVFGGDEEPLLEPAKLYDLSKFGYLMGTAGNSPRMTLEEFFLKWKKNQASTTITTEVPNERVEEFRALVDNFLGK